MGYSSLYLVGNKIWNKEWTADFKIPKIFIICVDFAWKSHGLAPLNNNSGNPHRDLLAQPWQISTFLHPISATDSLKNKGRIYYKQTLNV